METTLMKTAMENAIKKVKKKVMALPILVSLAFLTPLTLVPFPAQGRGLPVSIFENSRSGAIWDHGQEFYLVHKINFLEKEEHIWGGFHEVSRGEFTGKIEIDIYTPTSRTYEAKAKLLSLEGEPRLFLVQVFDNDQKMIKEFFVKRE